MKFIGTATSNRPQRFGRKMQRSAMRRAKGYKSGKLFGRRVFQKQGKLFLTPF